MPWKLSVDVTVWPVPPGAAWAGDVVPSTSSSAAKMRSSNERFMILLSRVLTGMENHRFGLPIAKVRLRPETYWVRRCRLTTEPGGTVA